MLSVTGSTATARSVASTRLGQALLLLAAAVLIRCFQFGNPVLHVDDQFYLLVADRMLHQGQLPYVDIWDRKPIGTFLVYVAVRLLGGFGIIQYQLVATLFAAATAWVIARLALGFTGVLGAIGAGIMYLLWLMAFGGDGGQTPVFYNLLIALAALLTSRAVTQPAIQPRRIVTLGCGVMLLVGLAIQIKYVVVFEGVFFGLALSHAYARRTGWGMPLLRAMAAWVAIALLPTALATAWFAALGHFDAFVYANFLSIFTRVPGNPAELLERTGTMLLRLLPLMIAASIAVHRLAPEKGSSAALRLGFTHHWLIAAVLAVAIFGTYYDHYTLPVLVPLSLCCAPLLGHKRFGRKATLLLVLIGIGLAIHVVSFAVRRRGDRADFDHMITAMQPLRGQCIYNYDNEPIIYYALKSCVPTRYIFPDHLSNAREAQAMGIDTVAEVRAIVATRPRAIMFRIPRPQPWRVNAGTNAIVQRFVRTQYRLGASHKLGARQIEVWVPREAR